MTTVIICLILTEQSCWLPERQNEFAGHEDYRLSDTQPQTDAEKEDIYLARGLARDLFLPPNILCALGVCFTGDLLWLQAILAAVTLEGFGWLALGIKRYLQATLTAVCDQLARHAMEVVADHRYIIVYCILYIALLSLHAVAANELASGKKGPVKAAQPLDRRAQLLQQTRR